MAEDLGMSLTTEQQMAAALSKIAEAVKLQAETNAKLASEMRVLTTAIRGAHNLVVQHTEKNVEDAARRNADMRAMSEMVRNRGGGPGSQTP